MINKTAKGERAKKKAKRNVPDAVVNIRSTFNNTIVTVSDPQGNVLGWDTCSTKGFKGSRKSTPFAAQEAAKSVIEKLMIQNGIKNVDVRIKGPGSGRESAIRALHAAGVKVRSIVDLTPIPHNGPRSPKKRRV